ncbi:hypothetical protein Sfr7A_11475 [Streptomyces xinghaiensis]|uniref:Uncharacterized protein n=1 Tax=Streptomyces xinghaiensis TaxID=1038928 RepID=A0A3M8F9E8_9ACTN|nr:hypothetical protein Sfr7A_11475 [Streptomyces xinghaiensis]RKM94770.1 hypothetical protein SFRA_015935 [Streptomyces xinghaiensis]RNC74789.1 hypothetical protein DC095_009015 [Streptomyces xinghaiensis]
MPRHPSRGLIAASEPYRSTSCRSGSHGTCREAEPSESLPTGLPLVRDVCGCSCHASTRPKSDSGESLHDA